MARSKPIQAHVHTAIHQVLVARARKRSMSVSRMAGDMVQRSLFDGLSRAGAAALLQDETDLTPDQIDGALDAAGVF